MIQTIVFYPFRVLFSRYFDDDQLTSFLTGAFTVGLLWLLNALHQCVPDKFIRDRNGSLGDEDDDDDLSFVDPWNDPLAFVSTQQRRMVRSSISTMADIQKNIGELPKRFKRKHWPWETIRRKVMGEESDDNDGNNENSGDAPIHTINEDSSNSSDGSTPEIITISEEKKDDNSTTVTEEPTSKDEKQFCIGSIFGLDVGGTLAKLVYFEKKSMDSDPLQTRTLREKQYVQAFSAQTVLMARRMDENDNVRQKRSVSMSPMRKLPGPLVGEVASNRYRASTAEDYDFNAHGNHDRIEMRYSLPPTNPGHKLRRRTLAVPQTLRKSGDSEHQPRQDLLELDYPGYAADEGEVLQKLPQHTKTNRMSSEDLKDLYAIRQESLPDDIHHFRDIVDFRSDRNCSNSEEETGKDNAGDPPIGLRQSSSSLPGTTTNHSQYEQQYKQSSKTIPHHDDPITKRSLSMMDLSSQHDQQKAEALNQFYDFARRLDTHEDSITDIELSFYCRELGGEFHFISFETRKMKNAMDLIRFNNLHMNIRNMGATGGGAHKFSDVWEKELGIGIIKQDELDSLVAGMQFVLSTVVGECYTFRPKLDPNGSGATTAIAEEAKSSKDDTNINNNSSNSNEQPPPKKNPELEWWTRKVQRDTISYSSAYPYMLVTIGTGVSVLRVDGPRKHERVSGSTIGGGTFWGLMRLLTDVENFEDAMKLAEKGDPTKVDMMVGDIYGDDSDALEKLGLSADIVASSFGKLVSKEDPAKGLTQEDLARALLSLVTNNIGQVAYLNAKLHSTPRIYFVGSFLRLNMISQRRLSYAIDYWSKGEMEALFLEHEGYFGSLGAFLMTQNIEKRKGGFFQWENNP